MKTFAVFTKRVDSYTNYKANSFKVDEHNNLHLVVGTYSATIAMFAAGDWFAIEEIETID